MPLATGLLNIILHTGNKIKNIGAGIHQPGGQLIFRPPNKCK